MNEKIEKLKQEMLQMENAVVDAFDLVLTANRKFAKQLTQLPKPATTSEQKDIAMLAVRMANLTTFTAVGEHVIDQARKLRN
jgi:protein-tyrosine-phosphatase